VNPPTGDAPRNPVTARPDDHSRRVDGIDALRGLAILLVLMNHVNMRLFIAKIPYSAEIPDQVISSLMWSGQYGVQVFFAVSGFLITRNALIRWGMLDQLRMRDFYALRFARIAPLLLALLAVLCACHASGMRGFVVSDQTGGLGNALAAALSFRINVLEANRGYLPASWDILWSLSVEEVFYLLFPIVCRLMRPAVLLAACLLIFVILGPFARTVFANGNEIWSEYSYLSGMDAIALGCLTALAIRGVGPARGWIRWVGIGGLLLGAIVLGSSNYLEGSWLTRCGLDMTLLAAATCMTAAAANHGAWVAPRIAAPLLAFGRRSYEIYLTHMFVVFALFDSFIATGQRRSWLPVLFGGCIAGSAVLGDLVARYYSEPMNRLLRRALRLNACADHR
jgi:peptidoglycan/LPS O-acetylase OafA/YrhL